MIKIHVAASRQYEVILNRGILSMAGMYVKDALGLEDDPVTGKLKNKKICIVTDATVDPLYGRESQTLWTSLAAAGFEVHKYVFPGGEDCKNMETIEELLGSGCKAFFADGCAAGAGRRDRRGCDRLRGGDISAGGVHPGATTLLAIVDSSVGGKTGDQSGWKELAGALAAESGSFRSGGFRNSFL